MAGDRLKIGVVQMTSGDDVDSNLEAVLRFYAAGVAAGAELVAFPENTLFFRIGGDAVRAPSAAQLKALEAAVDRAMVPVLLTTAFAPANGRHANATLVFESGRPARAAYEKIHMFDVDPAGAKPIRESDQFRPGRAPALLEVSGWRLGLTICFDLRFPELFLNYAQKADVIMVPSAFLPATGRDHWHVLLRARAIEAQAFVVAPAQVGRHGSGKDARETFGHGLVVGPWGDVRLDMGEETGVRVVELSRGDVNKMREQIPMANQRHPC